MFARTDRLLLRPGWIEDAPALTAAIGEQRIVRNLAMAPSPYGLEDARTYLAGVDAALPSFLIFARSRHPLELVGGIGFGASPDGPAEFGYWIASHCWNRGFATEAGQAALALARDSLRLRTIISGHFLDNPASGRVLEKLGFVATGDTSLRHCRARGEDVPYQGYALELRSSPAITASERIAA